MGIPANRPFRVLVTAELAVDASEVLGRGFELIGGRKLTRTEIERSIGDVDGLICLLTDRIDEELLCSAPRLKVIANHAVGVDNVDLPAATKRGIFVANTPDVLTEATADLAFALLLATARRLGEGEALLRSGSWTGWEPTQLLGADVSGTTLGIVGLGRIGQAVARRARGFGMRILYSGPAKAVELDATHRPLELLLVESDFVSLHCPLRDDTRGLISAGRLALMKPTAILVNTARGQLVDEEALALALETGRLAAAGLDVFAHEPAVHPALLRQNNAVLLPHIGSATHAARRKMGELCLKAVAEVAVGQMPTHLVNKDLRA